MRSPVARVRPFVGSLLAIVLPAMGCVMDAGLPADSVVLCAADEDCPGELRCNLATHACIAPGTEPHLTSVAFEPAVTNGGVVRLVVRADRALDPAVAPVIRFAEGTTPLPLVLEGTEGAEQRLLVAAEEAAEGLYPLTQLELRGEAGASSVVDVVAVALVVDRTPPIVRNARITNVPAGGSYVDAIPHDVIEARFLPSEPIGAAALLVGSARSEDCETLHDGRSEGEIVCRLSVLAGVADGQQEPILEVADEAGNAVSVTLEPVHVDTAPPQLVADATTLSIRDGGRVVTVVSPTSVVELSFVTSEDLGAEPEVAFDVEGGRLPLALVRQSGRRYEYRLEPNGAEIPAGSWSLVAALVDRAGHASEVSINLPPPFQAGVPFTPIGEACPVPPGTLCVDFDGDGFLSVFGCPDGNDPRDDEPTVFPTAVELPGDGLDNNGDGVDLPIDEQVGVFVDAVNGDDAAPGTRAAPVRSLAAGKALLAGRTFLFLAAGASTYGFAAPGDVAGLAIVGGLDAASWQRGDGRSLVSGSLTGAVIVDAVHVGDAIRTGAASRVLVRTHAAKLQLGFAPTRQLVIDSFFDTIVTAEANVAANLLVVTTMGMTLQSPSLRGHRLLVDGSLTATGGLVNLVSSVVTAGVVLNGTAFTAVHSTVKNAGPAIFAAVGSVVSQGSALVRTGAGEVVSWDGNIIPMIVGSNLTNEGGVLVRNHSSGDAFNPVASPDSGNVSVPPGFVSAFHIAASSPMKDVGTTSFSVPASAVADFDGECRYADAAPDMGADEVP